MLAVRTVLLSCHGLYNEYPESRTNRPKFRFVSSPKLSNIASVACLLPSTAG